MRLYCGEGNDASLAGRTSQDTDRITRTVFNVAVCRTFVRSVSTVIITRIGGSITRISHIATADRTCRIGSLAGLSYTSTSARSVRAMFCGSPSAR
jgi:hypothetical protein